MLVQDFQPFNQDIPGDHAEDNEEDLHVFQHLEDADKMCDEALSLIENVNDILRFQNPSLVSMVSYKHIYMNNYYEMRGDDSDRLRIWAIILTRTLFKLMMMKNSNNMMKTIKDYVPAETHSSSSETADEGTVHSGKRITRGDNEVLKTRMRRKKLKLR